MVRRVPPGRVVSYGGVAALAGAPQAARAVGSAMRSLPEGSDVPWWRVVNGRGEISRRPTVHGERMQRALLEAEGVRFDGKGRIDWRRYGWMPDRPSDADGTAPSRPRRSRRSVALAIREPGRTDRVLIVKRPSDDADLPRAWGLPAATLRRGESWQDAARRAAREKLGVSIRLGHMRMEGSTDRAGILLRMRLFDATLARGTPDVEQETRGTTRYAAWRWGRLQDLRPAARRGSLCCRLALESFGLA